MRQIKILYLNKMDTLVDKWLSGKFETIIRGQVKDPLVERFVKASIYPSLLKSQQGFVTPQGDIKDGLHLGLSLDPYNNAYFADIYCMDEKGEPRSVYKSTEDQTLELVEAFVSDFKDAVVLTDTFKPLCLFDQSSGTRIFLGYLTFNNLQDAYGRQIKKIQVAVP